MFLQANRKFLLIRIIDQKEDSWIKAGKLAYDMKKRGKKIHPLDCHIAVTAKEYDCRILTLNRHFKEIQKISQISLVL